MVYNKRSGKPRGYAFIEYEHERDMHCKYSVFLGITLYLLVYLYRKCMCFYLINPLNF